MFIIEKLAVLKDLMHLHIDSDDNGLERFGVVKLTEKLKTVKF